MVALFISCLLHLASPFSSERSSRPVPVPVPIPVDSVHVAALPYLNVRSADRSRIVGELGDGEAIAAGRLGATGERAVVGGLEGEWLALDDSLRVFDAFLWVADPPRESEDFMDYGLRVVDGMDVVRFYSCNEDYGGPSGFHYGIDVRCTKGQALNFFRRMLRGMYAEELLRWAEEDSREQWWRIMEKGWDGEEALWFGWGSEGGGHSFMLRESDVTPGAYCSELSGGTC